MTSLLLIIGVAAISLFVGGWIGRFLTRYPFGRSSVTGIEGMKGRVVEITAIRGDFIEVRLESQIWRAQVVNDVKPEPGMKARIIDVKGNVLYVEVLSK